MVTWARDVNNRGQIAGFTLASTDEDPLAGARGFLLAKGVKGPFTPIDVPSASHGAASDLVGLRSARPSTAIEA